MTTVSGIVRDTQQNAVPNAVVAVRYIKPVVGFDGGAAVQNVRTFTADGVGLVTMPDLVPGAYEATFYIAANANTSQQLLHIVALNVLDQETQTLESAIAATVGDVTPSVLQQAVNAKDDAEAAATALETVAYQRSGRFVGIAGQTDYTLVANPMRADQIQIERNGKGMDFATEYTVEVVSGAPVLRLAFAPAFDGEVFNYIIAQRSVLPPDTPFTFATRAELVTEIATNGTIVGRYYLADGLMYFAPPVGHVEFGTNPIPDMAGSIPSGQKTFRHFGAIGNNATDDTAACQAALTAYSETVIDGEELTYRIDGTLVGHKVHNANFRKVGTGSMFRAWGSRSDPIAPNAAFNLGDTGISSAPAAAALSAGDWFAVIGTNNPYSAVSGASGGQTGELVQVASISGSDITIKSPLIWSYTSGHGVVLVNWLKGVDFKNVDIQMAGSGVDDPGTGLFNDDAQGIDLRFALSPKIEVTVHAGRQAGVLAHGTVNAKYDFCHFYDLASNPDDVTGVGLGYGVHERGANIGAIVHNCTSDDVRNLYTTGAGLSSVWVHGVPVGTQVYGNTMKNNRASGSGASTHEAGAFISICDNTIIRCRTGVIVRAKWCRANDNYIIDPQGPGVAVVNNGVSSVAEGAEVKGNRIYRSNLLYRTDEGAIDDNSHDALIEGNYVFGCGGPGVQINFTQRSIIKGNYIVDPCQLSGAHGVFYAIGGTSAGAGSPWWSVDGNTIISADGLCTIGVNKPSGVFAFGGGNTTFGIAAPYSGNTTTNLAFNNRPNYGTRDLDERIVNGVLALNALSLTSSFITVGAESGTTDDLNTISGGADGDEIILRSISGHTITVVNGSGSTTNNIRTNTGSDLPMTYGAGNEKLYKFVREGGRWIRL